MKRVRLGMARTLIWVSPGFNSSPWNQIQPRALISFQRLFCRLYKFIVIENISTYKSCPFFLFPSFIHFTNINWSLIFCPEISLGPAWIQCWIQTNTVRVVVELKVLWESKEAIKYAHIWILNHSYGKCDKERHVEYRGGTAHVILGTKEGPEDTDSISWEILTSQSLLSLTSAHDIRVSSSWVERRLWGWKEALASTKSKRKMSSLVFFFFLSFSLFCSWKCWIHTKILKETPCHETHWPLSIAWVLVVAGFSTGEELVELRWGCGCPRLAMPRQQRVLSQKEKGREASWARRENSRTWGELGERHRDGETNKRPRAGANRGTRERHQNRTWAQSSCHLLQFLLWDLQYNLHFLVEQTDEKLNLLYSWLGKTEAAPWCSWTSSELEVIQRGSRLSAGILSPPSPERHLASIWTQSDRAIPPS